jgi:threonine dehydrogenase-like Zn-dependent dehydrogenase
VCLGRSDLEGLRVAIQGLGNVGMPLCGYLSAAGAALVVSDLDANRCARAAATYGATVAAPEERWPFQPLFHRLIERLARQPHLHAYATALTP